MELELRNQAKEPNGVSLCLWKRTISRFKLEVDVSAAGVSEPAIELTAAGTGAGQGCADKRDHGLILKTDASFPGRWNGNGDPPHHGRRSGLIRSAANSATDSIGYPGQLIEVSAKSPTDR